MTEKSGLPKLLVLIIFAMIILAIMALLVINQADKSRSKLPSLGNVPFFEYTERNGQPFGLGDMSGKINIVDFMFTNCKTKCPIMVVNMGSLYDHYSDNENIQIVSISVDPARDSLAALRKYAEEHGVTDNRWVFLRAPVEDVVDLSENGFMLAADGLPMGHSIKFVLVDWNENIRGYYDGMDAAAMDDIIGDIKKLLKEMP